MRPSPRSLRWVGLLLALGVLPAALTLRAAKAPDPLPTLTSAPPVKQLGQWVWTTRDAERFATARAQDHGLVPALLVGSVRRESGQLRMRRGIDPATTGARRVAAVVRLEDSVHAALTKDSTRQFAEQVESLLNPLLLEVSKSGVELAELQLDYDVPVSKLGLWAEALRELRKGPLRLVSLWITSVPSHVADAHYGEHFRGVVDGTILQLFDTGLPCTGVNQRKLGHQLSSHGLAFRIGVGAFERARTGSGSGVPKAVSDHGCWLQRSVSFREDPLYRGTWVFAANQDTLGAFRALTAPGSTS